MEYKKNMRFIILNKTKNEEIISLIKDLYKEVYIENRSNITIIYYVDNYYENIKDLIDTIILDFGEVISIHEGFSLNKHVDHSLVDIYIDLVIKYNLLKDNYTNLIDLSFYSNNVDVSRFIVKFNKQILQPIINKDDNRIILNKFFENNLNVLKTSKDLFINRNSLLLRLESISRKIGYNIQDFKTASLVFTIMNLKNQEELQF